MIPIRMLWITILLCGIVRIEKGVSERILTDERQKNGRVEQHDNSATSTTLTSAAEAMAVSELLMCDGKNNKNREYCIFILNHI